jgi:selenocysteine-specific elongation factor
MPQSKEHLEILSLMGVRHGTIALTKCDLVDSERLNQCQGEINAMVAGSFLQGAPVFQTQALQPDSYTKLLSHLDQRAHEQTQEQEQQATDAAFRLAIDRAFTVKGAGVVVTGTVHSGSISVGDQVTHFPSGESLRVRSLRVQNQDSNDAASGDRCALNLVGASLDELKRGHWLGANPTAGVRSITIKLDKADSFPRSLKHWMPIHAYLATSHSTGRLALYTQAPDNELWAEVVCDEPLPCHRGDRLVLRDQALDATLGGGEVIYVQQQQIRRRNTPEHAQLVTGYAQPTLQRSFDALLNSNALMLEQFQQVWNVSEQRLASLEQNQAPLKFGQRLVSKEAWQHLKQQTIAAINAVALPTSDHPGAGLRSNQLTHVPVDLRQPLLGELLQANQVEQANGFYRPVSTSTALPDDLQALWDKVKNALDQLQAPSSGDLAKQLNTPLPGLEKQLLGLAKHGKLVHIGAHRFYLPQQLNAIAETIQRMVNQSPSGTVTVKEFRDKTGIGRNVAIEVLEYFDGKGFTRRQGNERVVQRPFQPL